MTLQVSSNERVNGYFPESENAQTSSSLTSRTDQVAQESIKDQSNREVSSQALSVDNSMANKLNESFITNFIENFPERLNRIRLKEKSERSDLEMELLSEVECAEKKSTSVDQFAEKLYEDMIAFVKVNEENGNPLNTSDLKNVFSLPKCRFELIKDTFPSSSFIESLSTCCNRRFKLVSLAKRDLCSTIEALWNHINEDEPLRIGGIDIQEFVESEER